MHEALPHPDCGMAVRRRGRPGRVRRAVGGRAAESGGAEDLAGLLVLGRGGAGRGGGVGEVGGGEGGARGFRAGGRGWGGGCECGVCECGVGG